LIQSERFAKLKTKHLTQTIKQLGKEGKLKKVISAIIGEMESENENEDEVNSDGEFWKSEPLDSYKIRPKFIPLLPFKESQIEQLKKLRQLNMEERSEFIDACHIRSDLIAEILKHVFEIQSK
jgi:hypothetical protein